MQLVLFGTSPVLIMQLAVWILLIFYVAHLINYTGYFPTHSDATRVSHAACYTQSRYRYTCSSTVASRNYWRYLVVVKHTLPSSNVYQVRITQTRVARSAARSRKVQQPICEMCCAHRNTAGNAVYEYWCCT